LKEKKQEKAKGKKEKKRKENGSICPLITMISQRQTQS
jgi:hypothetical protein